MISRAGRRRIVHGVRLGGSRAASPEIQIPRGRFPLGRLSMARTSTVLVLVAVALVGVIASVAVRALEKPRHRLVVAAVRQPATSLLFVAQATGCFDRERLEVTEHSHELGRDALVQLLDGKADVAVAFETPTLRHYRGDPRLRVLSALHSSTRNTRIVARRDGTNADFFVEHLLTFGAMSRADVAIVDLQPDSAPDALASGAIDAAVLSDPHAERARRALGGQAVEIVSDLYAEFSMIVTRAEVIGGRREALLSLLRGLVCAEDKLVEEPAAAYAAVRERFPERTDAELQLALDRVHRGVGLDSR